MLESLPDAIIENDRYIREMLQTPSNSRVREKLNSMRCALKGAFAPKVWGGVERQWMKLGANANLTRHPCSGETCGKLDVSDLCPKHEERIALWLSTHFQPQDMMKVQPAGFFEAVSSKAHEGDTESQYIMGLCYSDGYGVRHDLSAALDCLRRAANGHHALAQCTLGYMHWLGYGGAALDRDEGLRWLRLSADNGSQEAQAALKRINETADAT